MPTYTPNTWVSGSTAVDAAVMNHIEGGVATAVQQDGSTPITGAQAIHDATIGPADGSAGPHLRVEAGFGELQVTGDGASMYIQPYAGGGFARNLVLNSWNGGSFVLGLLVDTAGNLSIGGIYHRAGASETGTVGFSWGAGSGTNQGVDINFHQDFARTPSVGLGTYDFSSASGMHTTDITTHGFAFYTSTTAATGWVHGYYNANG